MSSTALYRHFDAAGRLLYIGISLNTTSRLEKHMQSSVWAAQITTIKIEYFSSRKEAAQAEKVAIQQEHPLWNQQHNKERVLRMLQTKRSEAIFPTEIEDVLCFAGKYELINGRLIQSSTGLPMHADQATIRRASLGGDGCMTYFD